MTLTVRISTPEATETRPKTLSLTLPTPTGEVEILPGHAEAFFMIASGECRVVTEGARDHVSRASRGVCHVSGDEVIMVMSGK